MVLGIVIASIISLAIGGVASYFITEKVLEKKLGNAKNIAEKTLKDAEEKASTIKKEAILEAKEEALKIKTDSENENKERRAEIQKMESRILEKEEALDRKNDALDKKVQMIDDAKQEIETRKQEIETKKQELEEMKQNVSKELEKVAGLTKEEAKKQVVDSIIDDARKEAGNIVRDIENEAREEGESKARDIITLAIQKCATDQTADVTVTTVSLPTDEMKRRIIGREGRNIRAIENATGVDLIIDDTPDAVTLSSFDLYNTGRPESAFAVNSTTSPTNRVSAKLCSHTII